MRRLHLLTDPPLDGAGALGLLLSEGHSRRMRLLLAQPQVALLGILVAWYLIGEVFWPVHLLAIRLLYPELSYG